MPRSVQQYVRHRVVLEVIEGVWMHVRTDLAIPGMCLRRGRCVGRPSEGSENCDREHIVRYSAVRHVANCDAAFYKIKLY